MEAAVLRPRMMVDDNGNNNGLNAELEVKKLQELVRKLEVQNEQLRTRASAQACLLGSPAESPPSPLLSGIYCIPSVIPILSRSPVADDPHAYFRPRCTAGAETEDAYNGLSVLDEVELLDLDSTFPCDAESEDTWLYASPKAKPRAEFALSPLQWCRQVLDLPKPDVEAAQRSFPHKLGQAHPGRDISSSPALPHSPADIESPPSTSARPSVKPTLTKRAASLCTSSQHLPPVTQTSSGKGCFGQAERSPSFFSHSSSNSDGFRHPPLSSQLSFSTSELEDDSISMGYKLQDLTDVQIMARMQEESLRQDYASTSALATNRSSSFIQFGQQAARSELAGEEEKEHDRPGTEQCSLPPSHSKRKSRSSLLAAQCFGGHYPPQHLSPVRSSYPPQHLSPVRSSYTPHADSQRPNIGKLRRSMPNLVRAPSAPSVPSVPSITRPASSESSIRTSQSFDSSSARTRLQSSISSPGQLQQHVRSARTFPSPTWHALKAMAYVGPPMQGPNIPCSTNSAHPAPSIGIRLPSKSSAPSTVGGGIVPRPTSIIGIGTVLHSNISQPVRSLLTPAKSLSTLSAPWERRWRDGCF
ncbi:SLAIN motif-containing protein 1-like isoform X2 [Brienomyrus brachyistius]|uniref:SLAIN motif-containing protein 1-like isoform X2 n=1 Tax=Brienomyrus brachyistius TaxID=42636 RepID=UPI0020B342AF|nr:SLAIN motif-containing protein 1-like isoform X2 [Brienomyrus brachyistius]